MFGLGWPEVAIIGIIALSAAGIAIYKKKAAV